MYLELAPRVFRRPRLRLALVHTRFDANALRREIEAVVGDRRLDTPDLRTGLAIITKRLDTGSAWIISNNPNTKYWENHPEGHYIGNRHFRLADVIRASTAAPYYFEPQEIPIVKGSRPACSSMAASPRTTIPRSRCSSSRRSPPMVMAGRPAPSASASFRSAPAPAATA